MNPALKVLLVEDTLEKINVLKECISGCLAAAQIRFDICVEEDVVGARRMLRSDRYDLVVMDIQLPLRKAKFQKDMLVHRLLGRFIAVIYILFLVALSDLLSLKMERLGFARVRATISLTLWHIHDLQMCGEEGSPG